MVQKRLSFQTPAGFALTEIESVLSAHPLISPGSLEHETRGFVTPFSRPDGVLSHESSRCTLLALGKNERLLPASAHGKCACWHFIDRQTGEGLR